MEGGGHASTPLGQYLDSLGFVVDVGHPQGLVFVGDFVVESLDLLA
jgi:hypothetical protein